MLQNRFLDSLDEEAKVINRGLLYTRIMYALLYLGLTCVFFIGFGVFFFTLAMIPTPIVEGLPSWMWTLGMVGALLQCGAGTIYCLFRTLDECFYPANSRLRITGTRK